MSEYGLFTDWNVPLASLTSWLLTYALHSTVLITAAWAGSRWLVRRRPALEEVLWKIALAGGLITASVQLAAGVEPLGGQWRVPAAAALPAAVEVFPAEPLVAATAETIAVASTTAPAAHLAWPTWAAMVWALAALAFLVSLGVSWWRLRRRLGDRRAIAGGPLPAILGALCRAAGYRRRVRLTSSARLRVPAAIGFLRPEICLPERALRDLPTADLRCVLGHELAHLVRRDPAWQLFARLLEGVLFFQPLHRLASRRLRRLAEYLCDDWTAARTGAPLELARCLAGVAEQALERPRLYPVPGIATGGSELRRRVRRLLDHRPPGSHQAPLRWLALGAVAVLLVVIWVAPGWSSEEPAAETPAPAASAADPVTADPETAEDPEDALTAEEREQLRAELRRLRVRLGELQRQARAEKAEMRQQLQAQEAELREQIHAQEAQLRRQLQAQEEEVRNRARDRAAEEHEQQRVQVEELREQLRALETERREEREARAAELRQREREFRDQVRAREAELRERVRVREAEVRVRAREQRLRAREAELRDHAAALRVQREARQAVVDELRVRLRERIRDLEGESAAELEKELRKIEEEITAPLVAPLEKLSQEEESLRRELEALHQEAAEGAGEEDDDEPDSGDDPGGDR